jgi:hypothetical protein
MKTHNFKTSAQAYNETMTSDEIAVGDILIIKSEQIVGLADAWPIAVTVEHGELHQVADGKNLVDCDFDFTVEQIETAKQIARDLGFGIHGVNDIVIPPKPESFETRNENTDIEIEDITLIGDADISVPRVLESITMEDAQPRLTDDRIEAIKEKYSGQFKRAVFVAVVLKTATPKGGIGLGIAIEHDRGYWPVPGYWYEANDFSVASSYADELSLEVFGINADDAMTVIASTMKHGGQL